jgi:hypothetical protein
MHSLNGDGIGSLCIYRLTISHHHHLSHGAFLKSQQIVIHQPATPTQQDNLHNLMSPFLTKQIYLPPMNSLKHLVPSLHQQPLEEWQQMLLSRHLKQPN